VFFLFVWTFHVAGEFFASLENIQFAVSLGEFAFSDENADKADYG